MDGSSFPLYNIYVSGGVWLDTLYGVALILEFCESKLAGGSSGIVAFSSLAYAFACS